MLEAAGTKWNFLPFQPGLVDGHCIGVDPYYLTHRAERAGYNPQVILYGRRINDEMGTFIARRTVQELAKIGIGAVGAKVLVLGLTFKGRLPRSAQLACPRHHPGTQVLWFKGAGA